MDMNENKLINRHMKDKVDKYNHGIKLEKSLDNIDQKKLYKPLLETIHEHPDESLEKKQSYFNYCIIS